MINPINNQVLAERIGSATILDARSPAEFAQGHIPGARSLPLFSDQERAEIGTLYRVRGNESATMRGLELAGAKMRVLVEEALELAPDRKVVLHCWRGGQRSAALGWLLDFAGFQVELVTGGYKAYRQLVHEILSEKRDSLLVLGGKTGSGKTEILHQLADHGEQVIDLEGLARHKGSAFGAIGEQPQPTTEQFQNELAFAISKLDSHRRIWIENESQGIGRVFLPELFMDRLRESPLVNIEVDLDQRIERLVRLYVHNRSELVQCFEKIKKKLGGQHLKSALAALEEGDFETAAKIALVYYDKAYQFGLDHSQAPAVIHVSMAGLTVDEQVKRLLKLDVKEPKVDRNQPSAEISTVPQT